MVPSIARIQGVLKVNVKVKDRDYMQGGHKPGKPGILRDFSAHGKLGEFSGNYLCKTAVDWVNKVS